jgi:hypothetical protein
VLFNGLCVSLPLHVIHVLCGHLRHAASHRTGKKMLFASCFLAWFGDWFLVMIILIESPYQNLGCAQGLRTFKQRYHQILICTQLGVE